MKNRALAAALILVLVMPTLVLSLTKKPPEPMDPQPTETQTEPPSQEDKPQGGSRIPVLEDGSSVGYYDLEEYVTGVVLAEMPAGFEQEALKAQAVAARTLCLKRFQEGWKHPQAAVCTDPGCCQDYMSWQVYISQGGSLESVKKVREAVASTAGQVLTYENRLIDAAYFSCSGGRTEDAVAVWGTEVPYLQAKDSPGEEGAIYFQDQVQFSTEEFKKLLNIGNPPSGIWVEAVQYTRGGGVAEMTLSGETFTGMELRKLLGLRSTAFVLRATGDTITITTRGFGHRVGMSQYGADAMAVQGSSYSQILAYYYPGTVLTPFDKWENLL